MRPEKANILNDLLTHLQQMPFIIVTDYHGLKVGQFSDLRNRLANAGARCQVVKNSFVNRATRELGMPDLSTYLNGQTAIVTGDKDISVAAKVLKTFAQDAKKLKLKVGVLDNTLLSEKEVESLADLPSKEVLQAQLLGLLQAPATQLLRTMNEPASMLARLLQARIDKEGAQA